MAGNMAYAMKRKWLPEKPASRDYLARTTERLAAKRADEKDMTMALKVQVFGGMFKK